MVEIDFIEHAILHAEDFLSGGPRFDFRHEGWPYLPTELAEKVLQKASEHSSSINKGRKQVISEEESERRRTQASKNHQANVGRKRSPEARERMRLARLRYLEENGPYEVRYSEEAKKRMSEAAKRRLENETPEQQKARLEALARGRETFLKKFNN